MTVYIDVLIVLNIYITYLTLRAVSCLLHTRPAISRLAAAAIFGGISALAALIDIPILPALLVKAALTVLIVLICFGFGTVKLAVLRSFLCITVSMLICGAAALIHELAHTDLIFSANGYPYIDISALVLVISSAAVYGILTLWRHFTDSPGDSERVKLTVKNSGISAELSAIADSGNFLRDFLTGRPVILCREEAIRPLLPDNVAAYLSGDNGDMSGIRLIPMTTAAGSGLAAAFLPDSVTAELDGTSKRLDALIAAAPSLKNEDFDALISTKLLN